MLSRRLFFSVLVAAFVAISCGDDEEQKADISDWKHADLAGPPGEAYDYRGRIGDRHFFIGAANDQVPGWHMPAQVYTTSGWEQDPFPLRAGMEFDRNVVVVEADGSHFVRNARPNLGGGQLYRSDDGGESWELVNEDLPSYTARLQSDGQALFLLGGVTDEPEGATLHLMRSTDGGESWEEVIPELTSHAYSAVGGWVAAPTGGTEDAPTYEISEDSGESWQQADVSGLATAEPDWRRSGDVYITRSANQMSRVGVWAAADDFQWYQIEAMPGSVHDLALSGDTLFVASDSGALGRMSSAPSEWAEEGPPTWENVLLPGGKELQNPAPEEFREYRRATIFGFSDGSLAALTEEGMWRTSDAGESWAPDGSPRVSVDFLLERDGALISGSPGQFFIRGEDEESWEAMDVPSELAGSVLIEVGGQTYGVQTLPRDGTPQIPTLYKVDLDAGSAEQIWSDEVAGGAPNFVELTRPPSAHLVEVDGQLFVGSAGNQRAVLSTENRTLQPLAGGGLHKVDPETGESEHITEGFVGEHVPLIQAMVYFDGSLWATTAAQGVWKFDPSDGSGERFQRGLPADAPGEEADITRLVNGFVVHGGALYAHSSRQLFVLEDRVWEEVEAPDFAAEAGFTGLDPIENPLDGNAILDIEPYDDTHLLVAALDGLYLLAPETGEFTKIDVDFDGAVYKIFPTDGGLYLSLWQGGLHKVAPR